MEVWAIMIVVAMVTVVVVVMAVVAVVNALVWAGAVVNMPFDEVLVIDAFGVVLIEADVLVDLWMDALAEIAAVMTAVR